MPTDTAPLQITPELIEAIIHQESTGNPKAVSPKGARGIMQVMPIAWKDVRANMPELAGYDYETHWADPEINRRFGTAYLSLIQRYLPKPYRNSLPHVLGGYNAGVGKLKEIEYDLTRAPKETRDYIDKITHALAARKVSDGLTQPRSQPR